MDVKNIFILSCCISDEGTQKCHLGPDIFNLLNLKLGQSLLIKHGEKQCVCKAWIRKDKKNSIIDFDRCVYSSIVNTSSSEIHTTYLSIDDIIPKKAVFLKSIEVEVIIKSCEAALQFERNSTSTHLMKYLEGKIFRAGDIIKMNGISQILYIKILNTIPDNSIGFVSDTSRIVVKNLLSKERFEASNTPILGLGGLSREINQLKQMIEAPLLQAKALSKLCTNCSKSVLLRGPPGCGKSSLAKLIASSCKAVLVPVNGPDVVGPRPGETEEALRNLFAKARAHSLEGPTVMLFDEVDNFCDRKDSDNRVLTQLTQILDQVQDIDNLVVVAATNRPAVLAPALRRPGRFDREIFIGIPSQEQKEEILSILSESLPLASGVDLKWLAGATPGFVGADLKALLQQASYLALERAQQKEVAITITNEDLLNALHVTVPSSQRGSDVLVETKPVHWDDIGGLESVKAQIRQAIELPLTHPEAFERLGLSKPKGVLLYGPPGCAKTTLVRAAATSCHVTFLSVNGAQLYSPFVGDSEKKISEIFQQARAGAPCILFIDEIDSVVGSRSKDSAKQGSVQERVLSTLLNEMDGVGLKADAKQRNQAKSKLAEGERFEADEVPIVTVDNNDVLVVAATNRPDMLDDALLRPGRIDKIIFVPTPDLKARGEILKIHTRKMASHNTIDLTAIAQVTENFSGADLENLCREAALYALSVDGLDVEEVEERHFTHVLKTLTPTLSTEQLANYSKLKFR